MGSIGISVSGGTLTLRNLPILTNNFAIKITAAGTVHLENLRMQGKGVQIATGGTTVTITDTINHDWTSGVVLVSSALRPPSVVQIRNTTITNTSAVAIGNFNGTVTVDSSLLANNTGTAVNIHPRLLVRDAIVGIVERVEIERRLLSLQQFAEASTR